MPLSKSSIKSCMKDFKKEFPKGRSKKKMSKKAVNTQRYAACKSIVQEDSGLRTVVIYAGRFQPFHPGHRQVYEYYVKKYGPENVYIVTSNSQDNKTKPFSFGEKKKMMIDSGIPASKIVQVKSPYNPKELTNTLDMDNTVLLFPLGKNDISRFAGRKFKKNGELSYMLPYNEYEDNIQPASKHAYTISLPRFSYKINGKNISSGTELRNIYLASDDNDRSRILYQMYGPSGKYFKKLFDQKLGTLTESIHRSLKGLVKFILEFQNK